MQESDEDDRPPFDPERLERLRDHAETMEAEADGLHDQANQIERELGAAEIGVSHAERDTKNADDPMLANLKMKRDALKKRRQVKQSAKAKLAAKLSPALELLERCDAYARKRNYQPRVGWLRSTVSPDHHRHVSEPYGIPKEPLPGHEDAIQARKDKARGVL